MIAEMDVFSPRSIFQVRILCFLFGGGGVGWCTSLGCHVKFLLAIEYIGYFIYYILYIHVVNMSLMYVC